MWSSGDSLVIRYLRDGRIAWVRPATAVEDEDVSVLFICAHTPTKQAVRLDGSPITHSVPYEQRFRLGWKLGDGKWGANQTLLVTPAGAAHSIWLFWTETWDFLGWYVNLQALMVRTAIGFDTEDHELDLWIEPDLSWGWKDEDELEVAVRLGRFSREQAAAIRAEGERVVSAWPFPTGWEKWRPDPEWPMPALPEDWDRVE